MGKKITIETFIDRASRIHNNEYTYNNVCIGTCGTKISITCPNHGDFLMTLNKHLSGQKCPKCKGLYKDKDYLLCLFNDLYAGKYQYDDIIDTKSETKITIICPIHGSFQKMIYQHSNGKGCPRCARDNTGICCRSTTAKFIEKSKTLFGDIYLYDKVCYETAIKEVTLTCKIHGDFQITPNAHLSRKGCKHCNSSKGELLIKKILENNKIEYIPQYKNDKCRYKKILRFDFGIVIDNNLMLIEYQGRQHFEPTIFKNMTEQNAIDNYNLSVIRDNIKKEFCAKYNIQLLEISYKEDIHKIEALILSFLCNKIPLIKQDFIEKRL